MGRFTALVAANDRKQLLNQMLPYYEFGFSEHMDKLAKNYIGFTFADVPELLNEYTTKTVMKFSSEHEIEGSAQTFEEFAEQLVKSIAKTLHNIKNNMQEVPLTEVYPTFEEYLVSIGYVQNEYGAWGKFENPNAKWDYFDVGGRWNGLLFQTEERNNEFIMGTCPKCKGTKWTLSGGFGEYCHECDEDGLIVEQIGDSRSDSPLVHEVNWKELRKRQAMVSRSKFEEWQKILAKTGITTEQYISGDYMPSDISVNRIEMDDVYFMSNFVAHSTDVDEYVAMDSAIVHAFVDEDGWHEEGDYGYADLFWDFINRLDPNQRIWVLDCHI